MVLHEKSFAGGVLLEIRLNGDLSYALRYGEAVVYENHLKTFQGRTSSYRFRSVEQLRYDFEQDVIAAGGSLG